jgi:hypothetical protein
MYAKDKTDKKRMNVVFFLLMISALSPWAEELRLNKNGVGPIAVSMKIDIRNAKEELTAFPKKVAELTVSARNDSGQPIRHARLCVQAERRMSGCDFSLNTHTVWMPGEELMWTLDGPAHRGIDNPKISIVELTLPAAGR